MRLIRGYCNFQSTEYAAVRLLDTLIDEQLRDGDYFCIQDVKCSHDVQIVSLNMEQLVSNKYTHGKVNHIGDRHGVILAHKDHSQWIQRCDVLNPFAMDSTIVDWIFVENMSFFDSKCQQSRCYNHRDIVLNGAFTFTGPSA